MVYYVILGHEVLADVVVNQYVDFIDLCAKLLITSCSLIDLTVNIGTEASLHNDELLELRGFIFQTLDGAEL